MRVKRTDKERVVVAMSGGVDSSVAAYLLKRQGYELIGVTMCFNLASSERKRPACCGIEGIEDAKRVAQMLGIRHYVLSFSRYLRKNIIEDFCREYLRGRTPNPCVRCNQFLKFDILLNKAIQMGARFLATGHYARIVYAPRKKVYLLKKGRDRQKDQSYFLYSINKKNLPFILMPLGNLTKSQVRSIAKREGLLTADKPASQEICFIDSDYREFLRRRLSQISTQISADIKPGPILDTAGNRVGEHQGICFYTLGQREGLGIALGYRAYIVKIDVARNTIVVGREDELYSDGLVLKNINFIGMNFPKKALRVKAMIRYNHKPAPCRIIPIGRRRLRLEFDSPQRAVTPGQSAVFYDKETLLGGGIIQKSFHRAEI
jgi:tRNA-specific 2-thiouridylase